MPRHIAKVFQHGACADSMGGLRRSGSDFQNLTECPERVAGNFGGFIGAGIGDHDDPQGIMPSGVAVGGEQAMDAFCDSCGLIVRGYDDSDRFNL